MQTLKPLSSNSAALVAIGAATVSTASVSFVTVNRLKDAAVAASLHGQGISAGHLLAALGLSDVLLGALAVAACLLVVALEIGNESVSSLLRTASEAEAVTLLIILLAWFGHSYLNPGVLLGGDTGTHISRFLEVARGLELGRFPTWTNYQYGGAPLLWFTGPLTYIIGGFLAYLLGDAVLAAKVLLFTLHMASGLMLYAFLRRLAIRSIVATLTAVAFGGAFAHLHLLLYRGTFPQALTILFVTSLFYAMDGLLKPHGARWVNFLIFALSTAGLIVNHQPHALFTAAYLAAFSAAPLYSAVWRWRRLPVLVLAGILGALASVVAVVPVLAESDWVMIEPEGSMFQFRLPTVARLLQLVLWRNTRTTWGIDYWAYLGLGLLVLSASGLVALVQGQLSRERRVLMLASCFCLFVCLFMYNPVVRDIIFILFFSSIIAAIGFDWIIDHPVLSQRKLVLFTALILADLASTAVQPVARTDKGFLVDAGQWIERTAPNKRVVQIGINDANGFDADKGPDGGPISYYSTVQRIAGNHNMAATRLHNYLVSTAFFVEWDLRTTGKLSPRTEDLLRIYDVGEIVCHSSTANGCPPSVQTSMQNAILGRYISIDGTPVLFSQRLTPVPPEPTLEKPMLWPDDFAPGSNRRGSVDAVASALNRFVEIEQPNGNFASALAVYDPATAALATPVIGSWNPRILSHTVNLDRVTLQLETNAPGYAQLSYPWFPSTVIKVNGATVQPIRGATNLLVLPIAAGLSTIELWDGATPARIWSGYGSMLGLAAILAVASRLAWVDRRFMTRAAASPASG